MVNDYYKIEPFFEVLMIDYYDFTIYSRISLFEKIYFVTTEIHFYKL